MENKLASSIYDQVLDQLKGHMRGLVFLFDVLLLEEESTNKFSKGLYNQGNNQHKWINNGL